MKTYHNFDLTMFNSYRLQAIAERVYFPEALGDVQQIFSETNRPKIIIGGGCNIILSKSYYSDVDFVIFNQHFSAVSMDEDAITAQSGVCLKQLSEIASKHGLSGLEIFYDIPGTLGGAICMNAGAGDECIGNLVEQVTYFDRTAKAFITIGRNDIGFGYRQSFFLDRDDIVIAEIKLRLHAGNQDVIRQKMTDTQLARKGKQPWDQPNAGSVFKRPEGWYVGQIMDQLNLKGKTIGGAQVSKKHGGFIVNHNGQATGQDIVDLIQYL